jgi:hypothetical protein
MHRTRFVFGITALLLTTGIVVTAQRGHSSAPKPPHMTTTAPKAPKAAPSQHSTLKASKPAMATQKKTVKPVSTPKTTKTTKGSSVKLVKTDKPAPAKVAKTDKPGATKVAKAEKTNKMTAGATTAAATTPSDTTTPATVTLTPVQEKLKKNTNLAAKLTSRLPEGTDLMLAAAGFRNLGQFVAAVNVSSNLKIPFAQLKTKMVTDDLSLGQAIQALRPTTSATIETQRAEYDARGMISESELQPQVTSTSPTPVTTSSKSKVKPKAKKSAQ